MHRVPANFFAMLLLIASGVVLRAQPLAAGQSKFLGSIYSASQAVDFTNYFNQVTPENAGKWGSVEGTRDVMNDTELRAAYNLAKSNGYPFRYHVLVWGSQQPAWMESLSATEQRQEIEEWFDWVAANFPSIDYLEVVNEPINQPPDRAGRGNYIHALGGAGATGWDWIITAFRLARQKFPATTKLVLNEYSVINSDARTQQYLQIVNLLKAENLIDVIGEQAHAFSTRGSNAVMKANLDRLAATGLPLMITEMDIDDDRGGTVAHSDAVQLEDYQRIFPLLWEHPAVIGITLWGYRPGLWRDSNGAYLVRAAGSERPAMTWLRSYLVAYPPVVTPGQSFSVVEGWSNGRAIGTVRATDQNANSALAGWTIIDGTGASVFAIDASSGQLTLSNASALNAAVTPSYTLTVRVSDGQNQSEPGTVTINVLPPGSTTTRLVALSARCRAGSGAETLIMGVVIEGGNKPMLVQGVGPGIASVVSTALTDPQLKLYRLGGAGWTQEAENNDWVSSAEMLQAQSRLGASALAQGSKDAALLREVGSGIYTAHVTTSGAAGVALVEAYDAEATNASRLMALSTRTVAGAGDATLITGFVLEGSGPKMVLIRGLGPTLASRDGVTGVLGDPQLTLYRFAGGGSTKVAENDNWGGTAEMKGVFATVGAGALESDASKDAALLLTLEPGVYTAHVTGAAGTTGVALVEIFDVP